MTRSLSSTKTAMVIDCCYAIATFITPRQRMPITCTINTAYRTAERKSSSKLIRDTSTILLTLFFAICSTAHHARFHPSAQSTAMIPSLQFGYYNWLLGTNMIRKPTVLVQKYVRYSRISQGVTWRSYVSHSLVFNEINSLAIGPKASWITWSLRNA